MAFNKLSQYQSLQYFINTKMIYSLSSEQIINSPGGQYKGLPLSQYLTNVYLVNYYDVTLTVTKLWPKIVWVTQIY